MIKNILIVDDQYEVRSALRAGIESLGPEYQVLDLPSAEESMVVISIQPVDLLVSDVRLPGISGLELVEKIRKRNPGLKVILITGLSDPETRHQAANCGAEAFFLKPVDMAAFLETVQLYVGSEKAGVSAEPIPQSNTGQKPALPERLTSLRQVLKASSVALLNERGEALAQAGDFTRITEEANLIPQVVTALSAGGKVASMLGNPEAESIQFFKGGNYDLSAANVGRRHALMILTESQQDFPAEIGSHLYPAIQDILPIIYETEASAVLQEGKNNPAQEEAEISEDETGVVEEIFDNKPAVKIGTGELDEFWESAAEAGEVRELSSPSGLSYEQARQLGLGPNESPG